MNSRIFQALFSITLLVATIGCSNSADDGVLLDSFEGKGTQHTIDYGSSGDTKISVSFSSEQKACGRQSLKIDYNLAKGGYMYCARGHGLDIKGALWEGPDPASIEWSSFPSLSVKVYGSKRGAIAFDVKDSGGEMWRYIINDDFNGWQEVVVPFDMFKVREDWQPQTADGNQQLDFPIKSYQFEPKNPGEGTVYFDCVKLVNKYNQ